MFEGLRRQLDERGVVRNAVLLPGDTGEPQQGALTIREQESGFELATIDYGRTVPLAVVDSAEAAAQRLLAYLDQPLPEPLPMSARDFQALAAAADGHLADLRTRLADGGRLLIRIPADLALDRIGVLDGIFLFAAGTSVEARALPPTALVDGAVLHRFVTARDVLVNVELVQPWFGQPGGAIRFALADDFLGIRDLVASGTLSRVEVA
jgi:hypothetical protein